MSYHRAVPLTPDEARALRALLQDLTRSGSDRPGDPADRDRAASRSQLVELGVYLLAIGLVVVVVLTVVSPLLAIVLGAVLLVPAIAKAATAPR
jgi:Flp pilus assembly protein TadB